MTESIAARALAARGGRGPLERLQGGMSSSSWLGTIDGVEHVVRVPVGDGARPTPDYRRESRLLDALAEAGARVARTTVVTVDGVECAVARRLQGRPIGPDDWTPPVVDDLADALAVLHRLPPDLAVEADVVARFHLATIWPFDGTEVGAHAVATVWPDAVDRLDLLADRILEAAAGPLTVVHTDLHPAHLLVRDSRLIAVLDFGDAFAGVAAWDHACLRYYHGLDVERRVASAMGSDAADETDVGQLSVAWGLYKLAKTPQRVDVRRRVEQLVNASNVLDIS